MTDIEKAIDELCKFEPKQFAKDLAIQALKEMQEREENKPLTVEEIKELEDKTLFICHSYYGRDIVQTVKLEYQTSKYNGTEFFEATSFSGACACSLYTDDIGRKWNCYKYKPNEEK